MKNYEEIAQAINERGNIKVELSNFWKDGIERTGIRITDAEISPVYYLSEDDMVKDPACIEKILIDASKYKPNVDNLYEELNNIEQLEYKVVPFDYYKDEIKYRKLYFTLDNNGFAELYFIRHEDDGRIYITTDMVKDFGWNPEEIRENAHTHNYFNLRIRSMNSMLSEMLPEGDMLGDLDETMYIVSNKDNFYGSAYITDKDSLDYIAKWLKVEEYYIIPSSIHELIILKMNDADIEELKNMVKTVNETEVRPEEVLSYNVWKYEKGELIKF